MTVTTAARMTAATDPRIARANEVATEIKRQIGPNVLMSLGSRTFLSTHDADGNPALMFDARILPMRKDGTRGTAPRTMRVAVALAPSDTYTVTVKYLKRYDVVTHFALDNVYADMLPKLLLALDYDGDRVLNPRLV